MIARVAKPVNRKGKQSVRSNFVKSIVREVAGFAPYERRVMELIRNSKVSQQGGNGRWAQCCQDGGQGRGRLCL